MTASNVRIIGTGEPRSTRVEVDGKLVRGVQSVTIELGVKRKPTATIIVRGADLNLDGMMHVQAVRQGENVIPFQPRPKDEDLS